MNTMLHPSRIQHNRDTGADVQQGPVARILFRLRPCVNLFYCLLLIHILRFLTITEEEAGILASATSEVLSRTWTTRGLGHCSARYHKDRIPQGVFGVSS